MGVGVIGMISMISMGMSSLTTSGCDGDQRADAERYIAVKVHRKGVIIAGGEENGKDRGEGEATLPLG